MRTLYYFETPVRENKALVNTTFNMEEAEGKQGFRVANMEDLSFDLAAGESIYEGLFQIWDKETELPIVVTYFEKWDKNEFDEDILVDCGYRKATYRELQSISCDACKIKDECNDRIKI